MNLHPGPECSQRQRISTHIKNSVNRLSNLEATSDGIFWYMQSAKVLKLGCTYLLPLARWTLAEEFPRKQPIQDGYTPESSSLEA